MRKLKISESTATMVERVMVDHTAELVSEVRRGSVPGMLRVLGNIVALINSIVTSAED